MNRYFKEWQFNRVKNDFDFLIKRVVRSAGELDFRIRDGYFNIYYQGNSLAYIGIRQKGYLVKIHHKFLQGDVFKGDERFSEKGTLRGENVEFRLESNELKPFFQQKYLTKLQSNIKKVPTSEEITFEHILITDNLNRDDLIIIDRQVTETALRGKRIDLLALKQVQGAEYQFLVIEVKLGKNKELAGPVLSQLRFYMKHIEDTNHFYDWKTSYEQTYLQLKSLGLLVKPIYPEIRITRGVKGLVAVGGYSGVAEIYIEQLRPDLGTIELKQFVNRF